MVVRIRDDVEKEEAFRGLCAMVVENLSLCVSLSHRIAWIKQSCLCFTVAGEIKPIWCHEFPSYPLQSHRQLACKNTDSTAVSYFFCDLIDHLSRFFTARKSGVRTCTTKYARFFMVTSRCDLSLSLTHPTTPRERMMVCMTAFSRCWEMAAGSIT